MANEARSDRPDARQGGRAADALVHSLIAEGVTTVFSLSGNQIMSVYDALIGAPIRLVHTRHEAAAVHMADAWGQLTGEPGIALVTAGPGFANTVSALYDAQMAESPLVLLAGHAALDELGSGAMQEMRQAELGALVAKASWLVREPAELGCDLARAMRLARGGRPGPVVLSLPVDLLEAEAGDSGGTGLVDAPTAPPEAELDAILRELGAARRPLIMHGPAAGRGRLGERLRELGRRLHVPVVPLTTPRGVKDPVLGAFAEILPEADLILLVGKEPDYQLRFGTTPTLAPTTRFLQLDPDAGALARSRRLLGERLALQLRGDLGAVLERWLERGSIPPADPAWAAAVEAAISTRVGAGLARLSRPEGPVHGADVARAVQPILEASGRSVVILDGGEFGQWAMAGLDAPRRLTNGPAASIGTALPFAIAARIVEPEGPVVAVTGDGGLGFQIGELDTAVRERTPFVLIVGNDARWNGEVQIQLRDYGPNRVFGCDLLPTRYDRIAQAFGAFGAHVERPDELGPALGAALDSGRPALVNVAIESLLAPAPRLDPAG